ncbi:MAG: hypothetical protein C0596_08060 [Marinilabiliales bacterium]|nr:MAG: hypothetical protein C0596_08060 [Marinilabiliales bacterium]
MQSKLIYIILFFFLLSIKAFPTDRDSLNIDKNSDISVNYLPDDFKDNYDSKDFKYEYNSDSEGLSWSERVTRWFYNLLRKIFDFKPTQKGLKITQYIIKALYYIALVLIIFLIVRSLIRKEGYWIFGKKSDKLEIATENIEVDLMETDFDRLINDAVLKNNYNLAVRYYYLKTLKVLTEKEIIEWDADKTNLDYLMEIDKTHIQNLFQKISYIYDYCWYGEFTLDQSSFNEAESRFISFFKTIGK